MDSHACRRGRLAGLCLSVLVGLMVAGPARGAHAWRGYWAAPATLETIAGRRGPGSSLEVAHRQPFGLAGLAFAKARWRLPRGWGACHVGALQGPSYREWHAGLGRSFHVGAVGLFAGARIFGLAAGDRSWPLELAGTALARIELAARGRLWIEGGVVDGGARDPRRLPSIFVGRAGWRSPSGALLLERCAVYDAGEETTVYLAWELGGVGLAHGLRWSTGEALLELRFRPGPCDVEVGGCWHPELGWTPRFGLALGRADEPTSASTGEPAGEPAKEGDQ